MIRRPARSLSVADEQQPVVDGLIEQDLGRCFARQVVLGGKRRQHVPAGFPPRGAREESALPQRTPAAHEHHADAVHTLLFNGGQDVAIDAAAAHHELALLGLVEQRDLVAELRSSLVVARRRDRFHLFRQFIDDFVVATFQEFDGAHHVGPVSCPC